MARISILMGIYNCANTLLEALDSLYAQTYKDFKIILCDDGSSDNTYEIAKEYAKHHDNIILLSNGVNKGLNYTLNHCLEYADTEYCARMDGDDISLPSRFEKEINFLDSHPEYAIVSCPMFYFDESGVFGQGGRHGEPNIKNLIHGPLFCHAPCMIRTEAYKNVGGYTVDKRLLRYEDYNLWMKLYEKGYRGYNLKECLYAMRDDRNAIKRRSLKTKLNGIYAHYLAYKSLNLSLSGLIKYSSKALFKGLIPTYFYTKIHKRKLNKNKNNVKDTTFICPNVSPGK